MTHEHQQLEGWQFEVQEVSAGVYRVTGRDRFGRRVSSTGTDPDALLQECRTTALGLRHPMERLPPQVE